MELRAEYEISFYEEITDYLVLMRHNAFIRLYAGGRNADK